MDFLIDRIDWYSQGRKRFGSLRVQHGRIVETGNRLAPRPGERVLHGSGYLALPGLINGHDHLGLNLLSKLGDPPYRNFYKWAEAIYRPDEPPIADVLRVPLADRLHWSGLKNVMSGVTTVVHHDPFHAAFNTGQFPVKVLDRYGWSHSLGFGEDPAAAFARSAEAPFIIHAAEGVDADSLREIDGLETLGLLSSRTVLVHAIAVDTRAISKLARYGCSIVWCPASNLHLFGQTAPIDRMQRKLRICLGTDSTLSGSPTLLDELRTAHDTGLATPRELLEMVTTAPAEIYHLRDGRGTLEPGAPADLWVIPKARESPAETLLGTSPADIALVTVDGIPKFSNPEFAAALELGDANAIVDGEAKWIGGPFVETRRRIGQSIDAAILSDHPLWHRLQA